MINPNLYLVESPTWAWEDGINEIVQDLASYTATLTDEVYDGPHRMTDQEIRELFCAFITDAKAMMKGFAE